MPKKTEKVCGAVYFGFEVVRCQLPAGHEGNHAAGRFAWWRRATGSARRKYARQSYQAELQKRATLKEG